MMNHSSASNSSPNPVSKAADRGAILATGFGTTVAMWAVGYVSRIPPARTPAALVLGLLVLIAVAGGFVCGRYTSRGTWGGVATGLLCALLNMLVLGSLLADRGQAAAPSALMWIPGALIFLGALGALGGWLGARGRASATTTVNWTSSFVLVDAVATLLLLGVGGLVTSWEAGLAVVDWPNSYGYNMFLYPLSRMTGGIYYEHAHRLFGSLVGLTTLVLAIHIWSTDKRRWVARLGLLGLGMVVIQGILGGLRVTGHFTLSTDPSQVAPSLALAMVHGIFGQLFFSLLVLLAVITTTAYREASPVEGRGNSLDRPLSLAFAGMVILQLVLGALVRHVRSQQFGTGIVIHITMASLVAVAALVLGLRAWGAHKQIPVLRRLGAWLLWVMPIQLCLGLGALTAIMLRAKEAGPGWTEVALTTSHQVNGALLLALAVALAVWIRRLLPAPD